MGRKGLARVEPSTGVLRGTMSQPSGDGAGLAGLAAEQEQRGCLQSERQYAGQLGEPATGWEGSAPFPRSPHPHERLHIQTALCQACYVLMPLHHATMSVGSTRESGVALSDLSVITYSNLIWEVLFYVTTVLMLSLMSTHSNI
jgi:hypothetical protein